MTVSGSCHCGKTAFRVDAEMPAQLTRWTARSAPIVAAPLSATARPSTRWKVVRQPPVRVRKLQRAVGTELAKHDPRSHRSRSEVSIDDDDAARPS